MLNHRRGLTKNFGYWFVVYPFLFVIHCFFVILFLGFLFSCQHHWYLQKISLAPIYPLFKCSNENRNELCLAFYFLREMPNLKREEEKRKREDGKTNKHLIWNFKHEAISKKLPVLWNQQVSTCLKHLHEPLNQDRPKFLIDWNACMCHHLIKPL